MNNATHLEKFKAAVNHELEEQYLYYADFSPHMRLKVAEKLNIQQKNIADYFEMFQPASICRSPNERFEYLKKPDALEYYKDIEIPDNAMVDRLGVLLLPGSMYHFSRRISPLKNTDDLNDFIDYPFYPDLEGIEQSKMDKSVKEAHDAGKVAACYIGKIYEFAWQIRGYEEFLMDIILNPEICECILDKITERNIHLAEMAAKAGADYINTGDDVANQNNLIFAPETWRKLIKSRWAKVYEAARRIKPDIQIWYHSDGNIIDIIPELVEIGVTILNPIQPECMDVETIRKKYGDKLVLDGTIGTQTTMPFATPEEVTSAIKGRKKAFNDGRALIIAPTHMLEPEVSIENFLAFINACQEKM